MMIEKFLIEEFGKSNVLSLQTVSISAPKANEIQIKITAIGVNFIDIYLRKGLLPGNIDFPLGVGVEGVGEIVGLGSQVTQLKIGDRVACVGGTPASYATFINFPSERAILLPNEISDEYAAASIFKGLTAEYLINRCVSVKPNQTVLWHSASGGVGQIAIQWLKSIGAKVIGTVSQKEKAKLAYENGCDIVVITSEEDFYETVLDATQGKGVDFVYDSVGKSTFESSIKCVKQRGTLILFGNSSGKVDSFNPALLGTQGSIYLTRPSISHYISDPTELQIGANAVLSAMRENKFKIKSINKYPLELAKNAHDALENRLTMGSTILLPNT